MADFESVGLSQQLANDMNAVLQQRVEAAEPVQTFTNRNGKVLELVRENDGTQFVRRSYDRSGMHGIENYDLTFPEAWKAFQAMYAEAEIDMTPTALVSFDRSNSSVAVMVSEFLPDLRSLKEASTATKVSLAKRLPKLFTGHEGVMLSSEAIMPDMFAVTGSDDDERVLLLDIDPYVKTPHPAQLDVYTGHYIKRFSELMWDEWCDEDERKPVIIAFIRAAFEVLGEGAISDLDSDTGSAFANAHFMTQGMDPRAFGLSRL